MDTIREGGPHNWMSRKRTLVLLVECTIAATAAECMGLAVTLTGAGHQKREQYNAYSKRTHPNEDVPIVIGQRQDSQWATFSTVHIKHRPFVYKETYVSYRLERW